MRRLLPLFLLMCITASAAAQEFNARFEKAYLKKDTTEVKRILEEWMKADFRDPELFVARYNYLVDKSALEGLVLTSGGQGKEGLSVMDSSGNEVGFISDVKVYQQEILEQAFIVIDSGIMLHPDRLDLRFGKIYILLDAGKDERCIAAIREVVDEHFTRHRKWKWKKGVPVDDAEKVILGACQDYIMQFYDKEEKPSAHIRSIAEKVLQYKPDDPIMLSYAGVSYVLEEEYAKALPHYLHAEKGAPEDYIVLMNIATCYKKTGNSKKAVKYYELAAKYGDQDVKDEAAEQIGKLKGQ